jgi:hypothetical protein
MVLTGHPHSLAPSLFPLDTFSLSLFPRRSASRFSLRPVSAITIAITIAITNTNNATLFLTPRSILLTSLDFPPRTFYLLFQ